MLPLKGCGIMEDKIAAKIFDIWNRLCEEFHIPNIELVICNTTEYNKYKAALWNNFLGKDLFTEDNFDSTPSMATTLTRTFPDNNNVVSFCIAGVVMNIDLIHDTSSWDTETRNQLFELLLRHEFGHMISMYCVYNGKTMSETEEIDEYFSHITREIYSSFENPDDPTFAEYMSLPLESMANEFGHVNVERLVELSEKLAELTAREKELI